MDFLRSSSMEMISLSGDTFLGQMQSDEKTPALLAAEDTALATGSSDLKKNMDSIPSLLHHFRDNSVNVETSVDTGRANEDEFETELDDLKKRMKGLEEENFMLGADLQFQQVENQKLENHWKVKFQALLDCEEKLRSSVLEQEANFQQIEVQLNQITETKEKLFAELEAVKVLMQQNFKLQELALKTDEYKEVKKERKEKKKLERKQQLEREKEEHKALKKSEKKEKEEREGTQRRKMFPSFLFKRRSSVMSSIIRQAPDTPHSLSP